MNFRAKLLTISILPVVFISLAALLLIDSQSRKLAENQGEVGDDSIYNGDHLQNHTRAAGILAPPVGDAGYGEPCLSDGLECDWQIRFGSNHPGITNFAMCDGSVHAISVSVDLQAYEWLAMRDDGEVVNVNSL